MDRSEIRELITKARLGDRLALQRLMAMFAMSTSRHIRNLLPKSHQAIIDPEDILQLTFIDVVRDIGQLHGESEEEFRAWLKAIATHRLQDTIRATSRAKRGGGHQSVMPIAYSTDSMCALAELLSSDGRSPSGYVQRKEIIEAVQWAIRDLPTVHRRAVELRFLEGKSLGEVAEMLNRTPRATQGILDRARKMMRGLLEGLTL